MRLLIVAALAWGTFTLVAVRDAEAQAADTSVFAPLGVGPAPSATRLATGAPGPKYWQNRADYDLKATLDTATRTLRGSMVLRYTNNSPDTLKELWFQTERRSEVIDRFDQVVRGKRVAVTYDHPTGDVFELHVTPAAPLLPGQTTTFQVRWHFQIEHSRALRDDTLYEVALWYPRPNVYDDVKGWNTESYATGREYYLEYGDYTMAVTVPAGYIVAATGTLENPREVLTPAEHARLARAARSDTIVPIVTAGELASGAARPVRGGVLTWKFRARNVRDMVWVASPHYQWDATSWRGILAQAYYRPEAAATWGPRGVARAADQVREAIREYSERWYPYPYPQASVAEGPELGVEYPMLSFDGDVSTLVPASGDLSKLGINGQRPHSSVRTLQHGVITHEVGHNWFPMIVGSNERVHTWMDEGFTTFINSFAEVRYEPKEGDQNVRMNHRVFAGGGEPVETGKVPSSVRNQYGLPAYVLQLLRRDILGPAVFDSAFRTYIRRWAYKHPTPADFFRTMEDVSGRQLSWFWRESFYESPRFDQSVDSVAQTAQGGETRVAVTYGNRGRMVLPLLVRVTLADGTTRDVTHPVDVWRANAAAYTATYTFKQPVKQITLDPDTHLPDADTANNTWKAP